MNYNNELGKYGESLAIKWLMKNGFLIVDTNWKSGRCEIDILARKENVLHAIEVKSRRTTMFGNPEQSISPSKQKNIVAACSAYLMNADDDQIQIDILAITIRSRSVQYYLVEDICGNGG